MESHETPESSGLCIAAMVASKALYNLVLGDLAGRSRFQRFLLGYVPNVDQILGFCPGQVLR